MTTTQTWTILAAMFAFMAIMISVLMFLFKNFKDDIISEMRGFKTEVRTEISDFKTEVRTEISDFKTEVNTRFDKVEDDLIVLGKQVAVIDGKLDIVVGLAHTHTPATAATPVAI
jgi:hypothetical protein